MTEAEVLAEVTSHGDRIWSIVQYWSSISFGLLIAAHITAHRTALSVLVTFLALYTLFTIQLWGMLRFDFQVISAGIDQLRSMANSDELSAMGTSVIRHGPTANDNVYTIGLRWIIGLGLFLATCPTQSTAVGKNNLNSQCPNDDFMQKSFESIERT